MTKLDSIPIEIQNSDQIQFGTLFYWTIEDWWYISEDLRFWAGFRNTLSHKEMNSLVFWNVANGTTKWGSLFIEESDPDFDLMTCYPFLVSCDKDDFAPFIPKRYINGKKELFLFDERGNKYYHFQIEKIDPPTKFPFKW